MSNSKRKQYPRESLLRAIGAVHSNRLTITNAARDFGIPRKTLEGHVKGHVSSGNSGGPRMLTDEEDSALVNYMTYMAKRGFPITRAMLRCYVIAIIKTAGREQSTSMNMDKGPSDKWVRHFLGRHPELAERVPEPQEKSRARMSNQTVMDQYFQLLAKTVHDLGLADKPAQIFNCDESGFSGREKNRTKVMSLKGSHSYQQKTLINSHITAHMCLAGDGRVLPTFCIFEGGLPHQNYKDGIPGSWLYGSSETGYMDSELFELWFQQIFIPYCGSHRPVLLVLDNHDTHITINIIEKARQHDIHILGLPPHTTHILQPLDVGIFGPVKEKLRSLAVSLGHLNSGTVIGKAKFPVLLRYVLSSVS
jgi:hypothetical protein